MKKADKTNSLFLWFVKITAYPMSMILFKPRYYYINKAVQSRKLKNACILMSNHKSFFDFPLYLYMFFSKKIRFFMAEVLFEKNELFSWFLRALGGIYVNRDNLNFDFIADALETLDNGGAVGIFPQGRLPVKDKPEWPFKPSIVYIALKTDAPIIPVYTDGNYGIFKRTHIIVGEPIYLKNIATSENPDSKEIERLTRYLEDKNYELKAALESRISQKNEE